MFALNNKYKVVGMKSQYEVEKCKVYNNSSTKKFTRGFWLSLENFSSFDKNDNTLCKL